jgi:hypothetical protein
MVISVHLYIRLIPANNATTNDTKMTLKLRQGYV